MSKFLGFTVDLDFGKKEPKQAEVSGLEAQRQAMLEREEKRWEEIEAREREGRREALTQTHYKMANRGTAGDPKAIAPSLMQDYINGEKPLPADAMAAYRKINPDPHNHAPQAVQLQAAPHVPAQAEPKAAPKAEPKQEHKDVPRPRALKEVKPMTPEQKEEREQVKALRQTGYRTFRDEKSQQIMWVDKKTADTHAIKDGLPKDAQAQLQENRDAPLKVKALKQTGHYVFKDANDGQIKWTDEKANAHSLKTLPKDAEKRFQELKEERKHQQPAPKEHKRQSTKPGPDTIYEPRKSKVEPSAAGDIELLGGKGQHMVTAKEVMSQYGDILKAMASMPNASLTAGEMANAIAVVQNISQVMGQQKLGHKGPGA